MKNLKMHFFSLKINKSTGYDEVSANVVKNIYDELKTPLMHIFNLSISKGIFPDKLKNCESHTYFQKWRLDCTDKLQAYFSFTMLFKNSRKNYVQQTPETSF